MLTTFDLGGCMKAWPSIWSQPKIYQMHIVTPDAFYTAMNFNGMIINKKSRGSGYAEILIEAQLTTRNYIENILKVKTYAKALFCFKTVCKTMERLMNEKFLKEANIVINFYLLFNSCYKTVVVKTFKSYRRLGYLQCFEKNMCCLKIKFGLAPMAKQFLVQRN